MQGGAKILNIVSNFGSINCIGLTFSQNFSNMSGNGFTKSIILEKTSKRFNTPREK
jgi:hypothetical protein